MKTDDLANYGTVLSYATETEDNELTFTDYGGFVLSVKGEYTGGVPTRFLRKISNLIKLKFPKLDTCTVFENHPKCRI